MILPAAAGAAAKTLLSVAAPAARSGTSQAMRAAGKMMAQGPVRMVEQQAAQQAAQLFTASVFQAANTYARQGNSRPAATPSAPANPGSALVVRQSDALVSSDFSGRVASRIQSPQSQLALRSTGGQTATSSTALTLKGAASDFAGQALGLLTSEAGARTLEALSRQFFGDDAAVPDTGSGTTTSATGRRTDALRLPASTTPTSSSAPANEAAGDNSLFGAAAGALARYEPGRSGRPTAASASPNPFAAAQPGPSPKPSNPFAIPPPGPGPGQGAGGPPLTAGPSSGTAPESASGATPASSGTTGRQGIPFNDMTDEEIRNHFAKETRQTTIENIQRELERSRRNMEQMAMMDMLKDEMNLMKQAQQKLSDAAGV